MNKYLFFAAVLFILSACNQEADKAGAEQTNPASTKDHSIQDIPDDWVEHADSVFTLQAPPDWEMDYSNRMGTEFILFSPADSTNDYFRENVNLVKEDVSAHDVDLKQYVDQSTAMLGQYITDLKDLKVEQRGDSYWLTYFGTQGIMNLSLVQRLSMKGDMVYILTYTSVVDKPSGHDEAAMKVMHDFRLN